MSLSTRLLVGTGAVVMAAGAMLFAQGGDATKVMADMRKALGGEQKLAAVKALTATGKSQRAMGEMSMGGDYELMLEWPDKFFTRQVVAQLPMGNIVAKLGFNGDALIQDTEQPSMPGGGMLQIRMNAGAGPNATPEQKADGARKQVAASKKDLACMTLGMFGAAVGNLPLEFSYGGTAEAPDGKADVINVKGPDDFGGKLFIDQKTHLPLMFSYMGKEPMVLNASSNGRAGGIGSPQVQQFTLNSGGKTLTREEQEKLMADMDAKMKVAEAARKTVEYRMFYSNYQSVDGLQLPHTFQQTIAGTPSNEVTIEKYKLNPKIDPKKFETVK